MERGYGAYSIKQLLQIEVIKTELGNKFDYTQCIDEYKFLDPKKVNEYALNNSINITTPSADITHYWGSVVTGKKKKN